MAATITTVLIVPRSPEHVAEIEQIFRDLSEAAAREGDGVETYAYFKGEDGAYRIIECYRDAQAALDHVLRHLDFEKVGRLAELAEFRDLELLGETTPEFEEATAGFSPAIRRYVAGVL